MEWRNEASSWVPERQLKEDCPRMVYIWTLLNQHDDEAEKEEEKGDQGEGPNSLFY